MTKAFVMRTIPPLSLALSLISLSHLPGMADVT